MSKQVASTKIQSLFRFPGDLLAGAWYPVGAIALLTRSPQLWPSVIMPILVNGVLGIALYVGLLIPGWEAIHAWSSGIPSVLSGWIAGLPSWANGLLGWLPTGATVLDDLLRWLLAVVLLVSLGVLLVQFGAILGAPWYGALAEQVERSRLGELPPAPMTLSRALQDIQRAIAFQIKKLLLLLGLGLPLLLLNFFPPVGNVIASAGGFALAAMLVTMDFIDPPLERRRLRFRAKLNLIRQTFPTSVTFAIVSLWLVSIPLLNLVIVPLCVIAGTLFCCDYALPRLPRATTDALEL